MLVLALSFLAGCQAARAQPQQRFVGWETLFELRSRDQRFSAVLPERRSDTWVAGGTDILLNGGPGGVDVSRIDGLTVMAIGSGDDGATYAVGSHGTIWRHLASGNWRQEHQLRAPGSQGRYPDDGLLVRIQLVPDGSRSALVASGPRSLVLVRRDDGTWAAPESGDVARRLAHSVSYGPDFPLPAGCHLLQWRWLDDGQGWFMCHDRRAFILANGVATGKGKIPRPCGVLWGIAQSKNELFASCGDEGQLYTYSDATWKRVAQIVGARSVASDARCVYVALTDTIIRRCL